LAGLGLTWQLAPPSGILGNGARIHKRSKHILRRWQVLDRNAFYPDRDCAVAAEEFGNVCSGVQPIKSSCMVPPDTALELVEVIRAKVPVVRGTSNLGAPLAMDFSMAYGPTRTHNENNAHSWPQDTVEAHQLLLDKIVCFAVSICGGAHEASIDDHVCGTPLWVLAPHPPPHICRPCLVAKR
jgi:hypothetical protein